MGFEDSKIRRHNKKISQSKLISYDKKVDTLVTCSKCDHSYIEVVWKTAYEMGLIDDTGRLKIAWPVIRCTLKESVENSTHINNIKCSSYVSTKAARCSTCKHYTERILEGKPVVTSKINSTMSSCIVLRKCNNKDSEYKSFKTLNLSNMRCDL